MKKTLIALAAVAAATAASAQVNITGVFNAQLGNQVGYNAVTENGDATAAPSTATGLAMGDANIDFAVSEDLGGGLKLSAKTGIKTEGGRNAAVNGNGWNVSLSGAFGKLTAKQEQAGAAVLDAGITAGHDMHDILGGYGGRTRLQYDTPELIPGLSVSAYTTAWADQDTATDTQVYRRISTAAASGALTDFDTAYFEINYATGPFAMEYGVDSNGDGWELYGSFDAGIAKFSAYTNQDDQEEFAVVAPLSGALTAGFHAVKSPDAKGYGVNLTYALSKRTKVLANWVDDQDLGDNYRLRLSHSF